MLYQITMTRAGCVEQITYVEAGNALTAIAQVEAAYQATALQIAGKDGSYVTVYWTGYEFEARQVADVQLSISLPAAVRTPVAVTV
jgi:hypothetical protein